MRTRWSRSLVAIGVLPFVLVAIPGASADPSTTSSSYIVQMIDEPAVVYDGGIPGFKATKPARGRKIDPNSPDVVKYVAHLKDKHERALRKAGGAQKFYDYGIAFNGFAAVLTEQQAQKLTTMKDVVAVTPDTTHTVDTYTTPNFLGLSEANGFWASTGAVGENIIIGDLDSGFWPENPSFSDRTGTNPSGNSDRLGYQQIPGWHGKCTPGEAFNASMCNQKVIGAQAFFAGAMAGGGIPDFEFLSARDFDGHGSHTGATAGGNAGTATDGDAAAAGLTSINGIAPRARLSIYKVCYELADLSNASCTSSDRVAAIDQAVADGVDVLNHSIGATQTNFLDPVMVAFFNAAASGVFVAASAGNSGPGASTVAAPAPWVTTVAASTHSRAGLGSVTLGNGMTLNGASFNATSSGSRQFIDSVNAGLPGANAAAVALCFAAVDNGGQPVLDPAKVAGKIVLCDRGTNARINKSLAVKEAGGAGMVLTNTAALGTNADLHFVPAVHLEVTERAAVKAYAATAGATATVNVATINFAAPAPVIAAFSSRGPSNAAGGDILKPDLSAPGVDVLAAVAPPISAGRNFDLLSGTSMSAPHVAGAAALLKELRPGWSPMAIKSALMTTGFDLTGTASVFAQGAGHVDIPKAADPGLVYDSASADWIRFICGTGQLTGALCTSVGTIDPSDLNQASIAIGDLAGVQTVRRTVKNVGGAAETYNVTISGLAGLTVSVSPTSFTIAPGASQTYTVTFTRTTAALNAYTQGFLTWNGSGGHRVRSPVAIRPVAIAAPAELSFNTAAGPVSWTVKTGFAGTLGTTVRGLVAAATAPYTVAQDPDQTFDRIDPTGTFSKDVTIPAGSTLFRVGIFENAITPSGTDLDLFVYQGTALVGSSADADSNEVVTFTFANPTAAAINLTIFVHGFNTAGPSASGTLFEWTTAGSAGNTTIAVLPNATATIGGTKTIEATFNGLKPGTRYLGVVRYSDGAAAIGQTIVGVNTP